MRLFDLKNDHVFKRLFAVAPDLLTALINAIRSEDEVREVFEVLNPRIDPQDLAGKFIVLDILAKDRHGRRINVEMQVKSFDLSALGLVDDRAIGIAAKKTLRVALGKLALGWVLQIDIRQCPKYRPRQRGLAGLARPGQGQQRVACGKVLQSGFCNAWNHGSIGFCRTDTVGNENSVYRSEF